MDTRSTSPFGGHGMGAVVESLKAEIRELYLADNVPWIIGYSGGKDSTAVLQLVWLAIAEVLHGERHKDIQVITTDTGVENPVVAQWVLRSHAALSGGCRVPQRVPARPDHAALPRSRGAGGALRPRGSAGTVRRRGKG